MFDFSTDTLLNDLTRVSVLTDADDPSIATGESVLFIKRLGKFPQADSVGKIQTTHVYKSEGYLPVNEVATIALAGVTLADLVGKVVRLAVDVRLSGSQDGAYSRWAVNKGQPFYAEYFVATTPASVAALVTALADAYNKALKKAGVSQVVVSASTTNLVLTATNEYQRFDGAVVEVLENAFSDAIPGVLAEATVTTPGLEGFGTTWFITKNLRLPTVENIRFMGEFQDERPIANSLYNQYTFVLEANRELTGQSAVGQKIQSKTYHIVYVLQSQATAFEALVNEIVGTAGIENGAA